MQGARWMMDGRTTVGTRDKMTKRKKNVEGANGLPTRQTPINVSIELSAVFQPQQARGTR